MKTIDDIINNSIEEAYEYFEGDFEHEYTEDRVPYGDTYVGSGKYKTDASLKACEEEFKGNFEASDFVRNWLSENKDFLEFVESLLSKHVFKEY